MRGHIVWFFLGFILLSVLILWLVPEQKGVMREGSYPEDLELINFQSSSRGFDVLAVHKETHQYYILEYETKKDDVFIRSLNRLDPTMSGQPE